MGGSKKRDDLLQQMPIEIATDIKNIKDDNLDKKIVVVQANMDTTATEIIKQLKKELQINSRGSISSIPTRS